MTEEQSKKVFNALREKILSGEYASRFPSERSLMRQFGVSRSGIRTILSKLEAQHIITRRRGSGTYLAERAQSLASSLFGVIFHDTKDPLIAAMVGGISNAAKTNGGRAYSTLVTNLGRSDKAISLAAEHTARLYIEEHAVGVFLRPLPGANGRKATGLVLSLLREAKIPVVILDIDAAKLPEETGCDLVGAKGYRKPTTEIAALLGDIAFRLMLQRLAYPAHPPAEVLLDPPYGEM